MSDQRCFDRLWDRRQVVTVMLILWGALQQPQAAAGQSAVVATTLSETGTLIRRGRARSPRRAGAVRTLAARCAVYQGVGPQTRAPCQPADSRPGGRDDAETRTPRAWLESSTGACVG